MKKLFTVVVFVSLGTILVCAAPAPAVNEAIAVINPASGSMCKGVVRFVQDGAAVKVIADLEGLTPGKHGFHIHEFGDCSAPDGASAGSHYDSEGTKHHGMPHEAMKHSGDLGNIEADADGKAHYEATIQGISIMGDVGPIIGRGVIVHAKPDDGGQPVGNAGGRVGCGVVGIMKPAAK